MNQETSNSFRFTETQTKLEDLGNRKNFPMVIGEWEYHVNYGFDDNGSYFQNVLSATFTKDDFYTEHINILDIMPDKQDLHLLVMSKILEHIKEDNRLERIKLGMEYKPEPTEITDESTFKEQEALNRISKQNGSKTILEVVENLRLGADGYFGSLAS